MNELTNDFSLTNQFKLILRNWYWFLLSIACFLCIGYVYQYYGTKIYRATGSVLIKDTKQGGVSEMGALGELNILGNSYNTVENEIEIFNSRRLMSKVVTDLNLYVDYLVQGNFKETSSLNTVVLVDVLDESLLKPEFAPLSFTISSLDKERFYITTKEQDQSIGYYGKVITDYPVPFIVSYKDENIVLAKNFEDVKIVISSIESATLKYHGRLSVSKVDRRSSVLQLSVEDTDVNRAESVINTLVEEYNRDAIQDKNAVAQKTAEFIQERMNEVQKDLDSLERNLQIFKNDRNLTDLAAESLMNLEESAGYTKQLIEEESKINVLEGVQSDLKSEEYNLLPEAFGNVDYDLQVLTLEYNQLLLKYRDLKNYASEINPAVINLQKELDEQRISIGLSVEQILKSLRSNVTALRNELNSTLVEIKNTPENERLNRDILRNREVVESIYLLLSEKRETTAISLVVTTPKAKVVDYALANPTPISPKPLIILLSCLIISFIVPYSILYLKELLYNKVESRSDIEQLHEDITVLGELPRFDKTSDQKIVPNDRSILAESFRILRTNLQFKLSALKNTKKNCPIILVTSTVKGEGKTFVSFNTAITLALTNKKILLIGGDIRNPQIHRYLSNSSKSKKGLTELLVNDSLSIGDVKISYDEVPQLDIVLSGAIPPNPAELLMSDRMEDILNHAAEEYDYIVLDSAPTILVTDTLLISKYSDVTVYVTRANYTDKPLLSYIKDNVERKKLENLTLVLNDVKQSNFGYGSKYTYHYTSSRKGLMARLKRLFNS